MSASHGVVDASAGQEAEADEDISSQPTPRDLLPGPPRCANCHQPEPSGRGLERGRCRTCQAYLLRTGTERPKELWGKAVRFNAAEKELLILWCREKIGVTASNALDDDTYAKQLDRLRDLYLKLVAIVV